MSKTKNNLDTTAWEIEYDRFYTVSEEDDSQHLCRMCKKLITCEKKCAHTNLKQHLRNKHDPPWKDELNKCIEANKQGINAYAQPTASKLHRLAVN